MTTEVGPAPSLRPAVARRGLSRAEVEAEQRAGRSNIQPSRTSRTVGGIVAANVFTRFNAIIAVLAAVVLVVGHPIDAIFALVMVANTSIGIVQEIRAKRTLDRLQVLVTPEVGVIRDGTLHPVAPSELVVGDVIALERGDQVPVDGRVLESTGLEIDESALTGESDAVLKSSGDTVRSGSAVVAGQAMIEATAVGADTWIHELLAQAKEFVLADSELRRGVDRILQVVGWIIAPVAALVLWSQLRSEDDLSDALVAAVAGVVGLVPQGLVLLVSMALAVGILRLARHRVVVQELHAVEGLARVDVLCLDKTGTLTTGRMTLDRLEPLGGMERSDVAWAIAALAHAEPTPSATLTTATGGAEPPQWTIEQQSLFTSERKWSGACFAESGTWAIGAPEVLIAACPNEDRRTIERRLAELAADARRVLLIAHADGPLTPGELPTALQPAGLIVLAEEVRSDAADTMRYFAEQQVAIKIISGDNPSTVSAVASQLGVADADRFVDLRTVDLDDDATTDRLIADTTVFGRVLPGQKRALVAALQRAGHTVAMTGDGVNDIPALKQADIGIGMDTATAATKAVSQLVLLDGRFDRLPAVVAEGRRVIANMERVSALFVTKTVYAALFAVVIGLWGTAFPFLPRHMSLVSEVTIGIPAFALSFRATTRPYRPGYLRRVMRFAAPAGLAVAVATLGVYWLARSPMVAADLDEARSLATVSLAALGLWVLVLLMRPLDRIDWAIALLMSGLAALAVATPVGRRFYAIDWPAAHQAVAVGGALIVGIAALSVAIAVAGRVRWAPSPDAEFGRARTSRPDRRH